MKSMTSAMKDIVVLIALALLIVVPVRVFIAQPFIVSGESMYPTFHDGDYLIVDQISYRFENPTRGEVIVFRPPIQKDTFYIKRIIGLPGDTVSIQEGVLTVTNIEGTEIMLDEWYVRTEDASQNIKTTLGPDQYFVMGDNRPRSSDSRVWGPLPRENIMGRALVRLLPVAEAGIWPGTSAPTQ